MSRRPDKYPRENGMIGWSRSWKVWNYSEVEANSKWGFSVRTKVARSTICYKDNVLGIGLKVPTGKVETVNKLSSYKSMYESK
jgi:hypothetical protein